MDLKQNLVLHYPLSHQGLGGDNLVAGEYHCETTSDSHQVSGTATIPDGAAIIQKNVGKKIWLSFDYNATGERNEHTERWTSYGGHRYGCHLSAQIINSSGAKESMYFCVTGVNKNIVTGAGRYSDYFIVPDELAECVGFAVSPQPFAGPADGNPNTWYIRNIKVEIGDHPTPYIPHKSDPSYLQYVKDDKTVWDVSGHNNNGVIHNRSLIEYESGSPLYGVSSLFNSADNINQSSIPYILADDFQMPDEFTISYWWKYNGDAASYSLFGYGTGIHNRNGITLVDLGSQQLSIQEESAAARWNFHTITFDGCTLNGYINGELYDTDATNGVAEPLSIAGTGSDLYVGCDTVDNIQCGASGSLSDFRIYSTALSAEDIATLYNYRNTIY